MTKAPDKKSLEAAAELHRLAEAAARLRVYREREGHDAASPLALAVWMQRRQWKSIEPIPADYEQARRERPDLALLAGLS